MKRSELAAILRIMDFDTLYALLHNEKPFPPLVAYLCHGEEEQDKTPRDGSLRISAVAG